MALIGWLFITSVMVAASFIWVILAYLYLGRYNLGGVPNSRGKKLAILVLGGLVTYGWFSLVIKQAPFAVTLQ